MGQIFYASAYDIETKNCCVIYADKFHANCYSCSKAVCSIHYLLRQKPYHVMWGGDYMLIDDNLECASRTEDLLGISTYVDYEDYGRNNSDLEKKSYYEKVKFIGDNNKLWNRINVNEEAMQYFDYENSHTVKYSGFLVNHTKKLAINLEDYYKQSKSMIDNTIMVIDPVPVLTETGGGIDMAFLDGFAIDSTEYLAEQWCGDLLQIVDDLDSSYELINCCFAEIRSKMNYCYETYGVSKDGYVLKNENGDLYEATRFEMFFRKRIPSTYYFKVELTEKYIKYVPVKVDEKENDQE